MSGYAIDPYFMQAYNYQNPYAQAGGAATSAAASASTSQTPDYSILKASAPEEKKGMSTGGKILTGVLIAGAAVAIAGACKSKSLKPKEIWNGVKSLFNGLKEKIVPTDVPQIIKKESGNVVCKIPGKKNVITKDIAAAASELGLSAPTAELTADAIKNKDLAYTFFEFTHKSGRKGATETTYRVCGDKIWKLIGGKPELVDEAKLAEGIRKQINAIKTGADKSLESVTRACFTFGPEHKGLEEGVKYLFKYNGADSTLARLSTKEFATTSKFVKAYGHEHPEFADALKAVLKGEMPKGSRSFGGVYKFATGEKIEIDNNEIKAFYKLNPSGEYEKCRLDSADFINFRADNKTEFEKMLDPKKTNHFMRTVWTY